MLPENSTPDARVEQVDPETARLWLKSNTRNRNIRPAKVRQYARDMAAGRWKLTGEAIKFADDGTLLDGQHRLTAVIEADVTVPILVVSRIAEDAQSVMDSGSARRASDTLAIHGAANAHTLAAAARIGVLLDRDSLRTNEVGVSHAEVFAWIEEHPEIEAAVAHVCGGGLRSKIRLSLSRMAYAYYRTALIDASAAAEFWDSLATRANLPLGSPVLTLAQRLDRIDRDRQKLNTITALWLVFRAWNAWRDGETLARLVLPESIDSLPALH